jgi:uncharacterized RDD family membrane protein YckC
MTLTADGYITKVLDALPAATPTRTQIAMELRGHISERVDAGLPLDDVLRQLGDPIALAESYLAAVPLEPGGLLARAIARLVDLLVVAAVVAPVAVTLWLTTSLETMPFWLLGYIVFGSLLVALYPIVAEWRYGTTAGKRLMGLRVVRESGARISLGQSIVRQLPIFLQVFWIDALFAIFTDRRQRAFELLSKTRVVVARPGG